MSGRRLIEAAFLLPWFGVFLLTPPVVVIFQAWSELSGFPLFIVYVFTCWIALIIAGGVVYSRLDQADGVDRPPERRLGRREAD